MIGAHPAERHQTTHQDCERKHERRGRNRLINGDQADGPAAQATVDEEIREFEQVLGKDDRRQAEESEKRRSEGFFGDESI